MDTVYQSHSPADTENIGADLATFLKEKGVLRAVIAMRGEMGVGKTAFARGFARALGISGVKSPTYTVVNEYAGEGGRLFHFDMYRIKDADDLYSIGYEDYENRDGFCLIEWSENVADLLPADTVFVTVARGICENDRTITIEGLSYENTGI